MRLMIVSGAAIAIAGAAHGQTAPADPVTAQFVCDMTGNCAAPAPTAGATPATTMTPASDTPASPPPARHVRISSTRGFSFYQRPAQTTLRTAEVGSTDLGISFVPGSATLTNASRGRLAQYAAALGDPLVASRRVRIEGYTDATGTATANLALSRRRAQAVADYLVSTGVPRARFDVMGYGASKPLANTEPQAAENRRVVAVLL